MDGYFSQQYKSKAEAKYEGVQEEVKPLKIKWLEAANGIVKAIEKGENKQIIREEQKLLSQINNTIKGNEKFSFGT